ncbi:ABC transporter substrate-binding protein [Salana multivorans]
MRTSRITRLGLGGVLAGALALTACAPGPSNAGGDSGPGDSSDVEVSTEIGDEPIELVLYDGAGLKAVDDALIAAFTAKYPNITIETRFDPDNVQAQNAPRVLASANPPDIARLNSLGTTAHNGQLTNLDPWAEAYGWTDLPEGQLAQYRVDEDGVRGSDAQYSLASGFVTTGLYVNTDLMAELGIAAPPTTIAEWEEQLAAAKDAGKVGIMAGNSTGQGLTTLQFLLNGHVGSDVINQWVFNAPDATIATPEGDEAVATLEEWVKAGYFNADANGTDNAGALARFVAGEGLFFASGNWDSSNIGSQMENVTFVPPPALEAGQFLAMSNPVSNFGIPAKAKPENKNAAAAFLDFLVSDEARQILVDNGFAPSGVGDAPSTEAGSLNEAIQASFVELVEADGQVQFIQDATPGITQTENQVIQNLFGGNTAAAEVLPLVQAAYEEELGR